MPNIYADIPSSLPNEMFNALISNENIRIERILSHGHSSPEEGWYNQDENEWVMVLEGQGVIEFEDGRVVTLSKGDYINIAAREKHKVIGTVENVVTIWLAVFYR
ncbi:MULTISPECIES: cupin domain-containing protein [Vibrio]|uniref:Cupin, RmlC-type n=1 Tax=Vibrio crassostreae TaxID=246167 RepID=A0ABM9QZV9_9VIBR|nr:MULTISPECIES: cupin domain-containing protein [Vibrio]PTO97080.1 cupin domain-containing protein [Vibrio sp. 10N.286.48.B8]PTP15210.1 cupin domain-containing protein [Vibrio sp. 10N.286.51.C3]PTQ04230.1 cupin domain-containing protein [Vibrio sp. ZF 223]ROS66299.1 cupin 2 domain-containing protein [Vibrio crassostreae]RPF15123.1 cupin 2 domain-containing protein [Vibrio crassostreae]